ncbi:hypothetical protein GCM10018987_47800 [Streptomyces cremeus]
MQQMGGVDLPVAVPQGAAPRARDHRGELHGEPGLDVCARWDGLSGTEGTGGTSGGVVHPSTPPSAPRRGHPRGGAFRRPTGVGDGRPPLILAEEIG